MNIKERILEKSLREVGAALNETLNKPSGPKVAYVLVVCKLENPEEVAAAVSNLPNESIIELMRQFVASNDFRKSIAEGMH